MQIAEAVATGIVQAGKWMQSNGALSKPVGTPLAKFRSYYLVAGIFMTMLLLAAASPAQAATEDDAPVASVAPNFMCFIGTPSLSVFDPAQSATKTVTGILLGLVISIGFVGVIWGGIRIATAGKHADKSADGVKQISNTVIGITAVFGGMLIFGIIVVVLVSLVSFGCAP